MSNDVAKVLTDAIDRWTIIMNSGEVSTSCRVRAQHNAGVLQGMHKRLTGEFYECPHARSLQSEAERKYEIIDEWMRLSPEESRAFQRQLISGHPYIPSNIELGYN